MNKEQAIRAVHAVMEGAGFDRSTCPVCAHIYAEGYMSPIHGGITVVHRVEDAVRISR